MVLFARFIVENLSLLDYKTSDEVSVLVTAINGVLSVSGETLNGQLETIVNEESSIISGIYFPITKSYNLLKSKT
jgi:hypothetical protein